MTAAPRFRDDEIDGPLALALLEWQFEMGVDEVILDTPVNRLEAVAPDTDPRRVEPGRAEPGRAEAAVADSGTAEPEATDRGAIGGPAPKAPVRPAVPRRADQAERLAPSAGEDVVAEARRLAAGAATLADLAAAQAGFDGIALKRGARNFVFSDGNPEAPLMVIGEAPGEDEDAQGRPFVGRAGQLLDQMLAAIGISRHAPDPARAVYIANVITWHPPGNRRPEAGEIAASLPFLARHVELAAPQVILLMGNTSCQAVLGRTGITRMRGHWTTAFDRPALPMLHPAYLLRTPIAKREAWADLLEVAARLGL